VTSATPLTALPSIDSAPDRRPTATGCRAIAADDRAGTVKLSLYQRLDAVESEWRRFEQVADCTAFQTYDWLSTWQRHIGSRDGTCPAIVVASYSDGTIAFMLPLAVEQRRLARRLCWLGQELNDYNAPLIARNFSQRVAPDLFLATWAELRACLQSEPTLRHDWIELEKMPQTLGDQLNPFFHLALAANPSGAHFTVLGGDWKQLYAAKRSSATRRRDRTKRKHMSASGDVSFVTCADAEDARRTVQALMEQKRRLFARRGIPDMFDRPGWREFFLDIAAALPSGCTPQQAENSVISPPLQAGAGSAAVHVSRLQVGATCAATNLGIISGDTYYHMLASYDDGQLSRYGPGALHLRELLAHAVGRGLRRFDFTIGDEPYKLEWSDVDLKLGDYVAAATWRGWLSWRRSTLSRPIKRFIKQTPWAWRAATGLRAMIGSPCRGRERLRWRKRPPVPDKPQRQPGAAAVALSRPPLACVMGDTDLLRPLATAGIRCAVVTRPGVASLYSRFAQSRLPWDDFAGNVEELIEQLVAFGKAQSSPPVLFYQEDAQLILISRHREQLARAFRFVVPDATLVEDLLDKARFQTLAKRRGLPVPTDLSAQAFNAGAHAQIETYHCYVDAGGGIAGEFTGRIIRAYPDALSHTSALEITDAADVLQRGRAVVERLGLKGVAKFDFKRDRDGGLHLVRVTPRFTCWHNAGAVAGVNIPALVFADLTGTPRPDAERARAGVRWCRVATDFAAARDAGIAPTQWLRFVLRCEAKSGLSWDDPAASIRASLQRLTVRGTTWGAVAAPHERKRGTR
jgi:CelD/BcsL family acetyltransferase involved in cellulose biosynthesis